MTGTCIGRCTRGFQVTREIVPGETNSYFERARKSRLHELTRNNDKLLDWSQRSLQNLMPLSKAAANVIFCVYRIFFLNFFEQLPFVEQYHVVSISST